MHAQKLPLKAEPEIHRPISGSRGLRPPTTARIASVRLQVPDGMDTGYTQCLSAISIYCPFGYPPHCPPDRPRLPNRRAPSPSSVTLSPAHTLVHRDSTPAICFPPTATQNTACLLYLPSPPRRFASPSLDPSLHRSSPLRSHASRHLHHRRRRRRWLRLAVAA